MLIVPPVPITISTSATGRGPLFPLLSLLLELCQKWDTSEDVVELGRGKGISRDITLRFPGSAHSRAACTQKLQTTVKCLMGEEKRRLKTDRALTAHSNDWAL
jgi:hypothetical protein